MDLLGLVQYDQLAARVPPSVRVFSTTVRPCSSLPRNSAGTSARRRAVKTSQQCSGLIRRSVRATGCLWLRRRAFWSHGRNFPECAELVGTAGRYRFVHIGGRFGVSTHGHEPATAPPQHRPPVPLPPPRPQFAAWLSSAPHDDRVRGCVRQVQASTSPFLLKIIQYEDPSEHQSDQTLYKEI